jgi:hypothetical protein
MQKYEETTIQSEQLITLSPQLAEQLINNTKIRNRVINKAKLRKYVKDMQLNN